MTILTYAERIEHLSHPMAKKLLALMAEKETNLALSLDITHKLEFLELADRLGPEICILKTHIDILEDFDPTVVFSLMALAKKHQFLIFEDRKFADIGSTVKAQFASGIYRIANWADMITAHGISGPGTITALQSVAKSDTGLLLLLQMSSKDNLLTEAMSERMLKWAEQHADFVMGFIAQQRFISDTDFIYLTPGVHLDSAGDRLGQQYRTPDQAIVEDRMDIIIVGRAIYEARDPLAAARLYRQAGWQAYLELI